MHTHTYTCTHTYKHTHAHTYIDTQKTSNSFHMSTFLFYRNIASVLALRECQNFQVTLTRKTTFLTEFRILSATFITCENFITAYGMAYSILTMLIKHPCESLKDWSQLSNFLWFRLNNERRKSIRDFPVTFPHLRLRAVDKGFQSEGQVLPH